MTSEMQYLDLEYMEIDSEERLTERDVLMLGIERHADEESAAFELGR
jgi:hypothetical protein